MLYDMTPLLALCDNASRTAANAADAWSRAVQKCERARTAIAQGSHRIYVPAILDFAESVQSALSTGEEAYAAHCRLRDFPTPD